MRIEVDLVHVVTQGEITGAESAAVCELLLKISQEHGRVYEIIDARSGGGMSAEARRQNAEWHRQHAINIDVVVFGASLLMRTVFALLTNAFRLISRTRMQLHMVATEAEARTWIEQRRQHWRTSAPTS